MTDRQERRRSRAERWCFVCGETIPEGAAVAQMHLGILTHQGACSTSINQYERIYDRSPRGRWRPVREVRQLIRERRGALPYQEVSV
jgi:hypothetical protein